MNTDKHRYWDRTGDGHGIPERAHEGLEEFFWFLGICPEGFFVIRNNWEYLGGLRFYVLEEFGPYTHC